MSNVVRRSAVLLITCFAMSLRGDFALTDFLLKYPYQSLVRLGAGDDDNSTTQFNQTLCTGLIVNSAYILTHARCSDYAYYKGPMSVAFVTSDIYATDNATAQTVRWIRHESYRQFPRSYDLALLETERIISFNHFVHPAVLFYGDMFLVESQLQCTVLTWNDSFREPETRIYFALLTKVDVAVLRKDKCDEMFPKYNAVVCVAPLEPLDLCKIDLGSPLACGFMNIWMFVGLYVGVNTCDAPKEVFLFRKVDEMHEWLQILSNGAYVINGNNLNLTRRSSSVATCVSTSARNPLIYPFTLAIYFKALRLYQTYE